MEDNWHLLARSQVKYMQGALESLDESWHMCARPHIMYMQGALEPLEKKLTHVRKATGRVHEGSSVVSGWKADTCVQGYRSRLHAGSSRAAGEKVDTCAQGYRSSTWRELGSLWLESRHMCARSEVKYMQGALESQVESWHMCKVSGLIQAGSYRVSGWKAGMCARYLNRGTHSSRGYLRFY